METEQQLRRKRVMDAMSAALNKPTPVATSTINPSSLTASPVVTPDAPVVPSANIAVPQHGSPDMPQLTEQPKQPPIRITYGSGGMSGLEKLQAHKAALEGESPRSAITEGPSGYEVAPPTERRGVGGRLKSIGEGLLVGLAGNPNDPNNDEPNKILGRAVGGGAVSAVDGSAGQTLRRRLDTQVADNDLARGLKLEQEQAQLGGLEALTKQRQLEPVLQAAKIQSDIDIEESRARIKQAEAAGLITREDARNRERQLDRASREATAAANRESQERIAGMRGDTSPQKQAENAAKRTAKLNESAALYKKADALDAEASKLHGQADPYGDVAKRIESMAKEARDLRAKGDGARAEGESIPEAVAPPAPVKPAADGKYHYTDAQIRAAVKPGQSYDEIYGKLKANPNVVID